MEEIFSRVSVREYLTKPVEKEKVEAMMRAAMAAPSACNQQPWEFVVVTDPAIIKNLGETTPYTNPALSAPLVIVPLTKTQGLRAPDFWQQDLAAAVENLLLEAVELDLGAVWMGIAPVEERMDKVAGILGVPQDIRPFCLISVGYPDGPVTPKEKYDPARVHYNGY